MKPEKLAANYDQITDLWVRDSFPRSNGIAQHERAAAFCAAKNTAIDLGCGCNGRIIDLLIAQGFETEGLDASGRMLELARESHPDIRFHHADICSWSFARKYDLISAWDSIWHVPLPHQESVMVRIMGALNPSGVFIFTMGGLDAPAEKTDRAMGPEMYYSTLGIPRVLELIEQCGCVCRHLEFDQYPENHVYVIAQRVGGEEL